MKINLIPASWTAPINSQKTLLEALKGNKEFTVMDISSKWNGSTTTGPELVAQGVTHAQVRYGKGNTKVWYGALPK